MRSAIIKVAILLAVVWLSGCVTLPGYHGNPHSLGGDPYKRSIQPPKVYEPEIVNPIDECKEFEKESFHDRCIDHYEKGNDAKREEARVINETNFRLYEKAVAQSQRMQVATPVYNRYYGGIVPFNPGLVYFETYGYPQGYGRHYRGGNRHFRGGYNYRHYQGWGGSRVSPRRGNYQCPWDYRYGGPRC